MHINFDHKSPAEKEIIFEKFLEVDIRIGEVLEVEDFPAAKTPSIKLKIDFGPGIGVKKSVAQITHHYNRKNLLGCQVLAVVNFPSRQIGRFMSEVLLLGVSDNGSQIVLVKPDRPVPNGSRLL